ncbi:hypothetical protein B9D94_14375 [Paenibacillus sp. Cedars]|nr:hypothetical protein B9D94_14375 [Paenibacillus sp. Cedars]
MANKSYSLAYTKWMCKCHIVFSPKYRRKEIYNQVRKDSIEIFRCLCKSKNKWRPCGRQTSLRLCSPFLNRSHK